MQLDFPQLIQVVGLDSWRFIRGTYRYNATYGGYVKKEKKIGITNNRVHTGIIQGIMHGSYPSNASNGESTGKTTLGFGDISPIIENQMESKRKSIMETGA